MAKVKCNICNKEIATWLYMPSGDCYCDNCVPRGCSCNVYSFTEFPLEKEENRNYIYWNSDLTKYTKELTTDSAYYEIVDEKYRRFPCCEYDYDENGFDEDEFEN